MHFMYKTPNMSMKRELSPLSLQHTAPDGTSFWVFRFPPTPPGVVTVLTGAFEFDPRNNKEATTRPTDNIKIPQVATSVSAACADSSSRRRDNDFFFPFSRLQLIRELGNINVKKKEPPFCYPYSVKAKVLVLSHLDRLEVSEELEEGRTTNAIS